MRADLRADPSSEESSNPGPEDGQSDFHTPAPSLMQLHNLVQSQDSIDVFHDAQSNLSPQISTHGTEGHPDVPSQTPGSVDPTPHFSPQKTRPRARHKSSGPIFDCSRISTLVEEDNRFIEINEEGSENAFQNTSFCPSFAKDAKTLESAKSKEKNQVKFQDNLPGPIPNSPGPIPNSPGTVPNSQSLIPNLNYDSHSHINGSISNPPGPVFNPPTRDTNPPVLLHNQPYRIPNDQHDHISNGHGPVSNAPGIEPRFTNDPSITNGQCSNGRGNGACSEFYANGYFPYTYYKKTDRLSLRCQIKQEFLLKNFKFSHPHPHLFVVSQWQQQHEMCCMYLAYRLFWAVYFLMWSVWSWIGFGGYGAPAGHKAFYLLYLTDWGIWLLALDTAIQAFNVFLHMRKIATEGSARYKKMKTCFKVSWVMSNITGAIHIFITLLFWTAVYTKEEYAVTPIIVNTRIVPCLYVLLDTFLSATPRRIFHSYLPMIVLTVYGVVTDVYYLAGGRTIDGDTAIYPILDWSQPLHTLLFGSACILLFIPLIHIVLCVVSGLRVRLWRSITMIHSYEPVKLHEVESKTENV